MNNEKLIILIYKIILDVSSFSSLHPFLFAVLRSSHFQVQLKVHLLIIRIDQLWFKTEPFRLPKAYDF